MIERNRARRGHKFLPVVIERKLPAIGATAEIPAEANRILLKFFSALMDWRWYVVELDPETGEAFGFVKGAADELGSFSLPELEESTRHGMPVVERDCYWSGGTLADVMAGRVQ